MATTVNRYTKTSIPRYDPMSLEELMLVPAYKRKQHDTVAQSIADTETALAQVDPLELHSDLAKEEQQKLYDKLQNQANILAREGFTGTSKGDFINLNKEYQKAISPTGTLGKINAAKIAYENQKSELLKNAIAIGYGAKETEEKLDAAYDAYKNEFEKTGKVVNFQAPLPPAYEDLQKDILEIGKVMGEETLTKFKQSGYSIETDPKGLFVIKTKEGNVLETSNDKNIQSAIDYLNSKWINKGGKGTASAEWQGLTKEGIKDQINSGLGLQRVFKQLDSRQDNYKFLNIPEAQANPNGEPMTFLHNKIQGLEGSKIDPSSPLLALDKLENLKFDSYGNIPESGFKYNTYEEKVNAYKQNNSIKFNEETGLYEATPKAAFSAGTGSMNVAYPIYRDANHLRPILDNIRNENPQLNKLTDQELVTRMQAFKEDLSSNYVGSFTPIGANFGWLNDKLFGSYSGAGEKSAGTLSQQGATINGKELTSDEVLDEFGYDSNQEFKEKGFPSIEEFVPALGKWRATAYNDKGVQTDFFIDSPDQVNILIEKTKKGFEDLVAGKTFSELGQVQTPNYKGYMYLVNDFADPKIVFSEIKVDNLNDLRGIETKSMSFRDYSQLEINALKSSDVFKALSGLDKTNK